MEEDKLYCPFCGCTHFNSKKQGFGVGKAVVGGLIAGPIGLAAGGIGSGKVSSICLGCGQEIGAGGFLTHKPTDEEKRLNLHRRFPFDPKYMNCEERKKLKKNDWIFPVLVMATFLLIVILYCLSQK